LLSTRKADRSKRPRPEATMSRKNGAVNARPRHNSPTMSVIDNTVNIAVVRVAATSKEA